MDAAEQGFAEICDFAGAQTTRLRLSTNTLQRKDDVSDRVLAISARSLREVWRHVPRAKDWCHEFFAGLSHIHVFGLSGDPEDEKILEAIVCQDLRLSPVASDRTGYYVFGNGHASMWECLSDLSFEVGRGNDAELVGFEAVAGSVAILSTGNLAVFLQTRAVVGADLYLSTLNPQQGFEAPVTFTESVIDFLPGVLPSLIFLREALGWKVWQPGAASASLIVDDPFLRRRYGFFDYYHLMQVCDREPFVTNIAFIPWNHRRSRAEVVRLYRDNANRLHLCVHGCDHTRAEFGSTDEPFMRSKALRALGRMSEHEARTGLPYQRLMVFPQGVFSSVAMKALADCGFLAAVNTTGCAVDDETRVTIRDLMEVAIERYHGLPLFTRHYPREPIEFAVDFFLGKPAFLVEHHQYFRDGGAALERFVNRLRTIKPDLEWRSAADCCARAHVTRERSEDEWEVRYFTDRFLFENTSARSRSYTFVRAGAGSSESAKVLLNGRPTSVDRIPEGLSVVHRLAPGEQVALAVERPRLETLDQNHAPRMVEQVKCAARRILSEVRDDLLSRLSA